MKEEYESEKNIWKKIWLGRMLIGRVGLSGRS